MTKNTKIGYNFSNPKVWTIPNIKIIILLLHVLAINASATLYLSLPHLCAANFHYTSKFAAKQHPPTWFSIALHTAKEVVFEFSTLWRHRANNMFSKLFLLLLLSVNAWLHACMHNKNAVVVEETTKVHEDSARVFNSFFIVATLKWRHV